MCMGRCCFLHDLLSGVSPDQETSVMSFGPARKDLEAQRCLQLGASEYVQKPSELNGFFAAIHGMMNKWMG